MEPTLLKANCIFEVKNQKENFQKLRKNFLVKLIVVTSTFDGVVVVYFIPCVVVAPSADAVIVVVSVDVVVVVPAVVWVGVSDVIGSCFLATEPKRFQTEPNHTEKISNRIEPDRKNFQPNRTEPNRIEPNKIQMSEKSQENQNIIRVCTFLLKRYFICTS